MNNLKFLFLLGLLILHIPGKAYSIDKETLWSKLTFADDLASVQEAQKLAYENPNVTEELLFISDMEKDNSVARGNCLIILKNCSLTGLITKERFFNDSFRLLSQITTFVHPRRLEDEKRFITTQIGNYGWEQKSGNLQNLLQMFDDLLSLLASMEKNGMMPNRGLGHSLREGIEEAKRIIQRKQAKGVKEALHEIKEAMKKANPREEKHGEKDDDDDPYGRWCKKRPSGNHMNPDACGIFLGFCNNLIWQINHTTF